MIEDQLKIVLAIHQIPYLYITNNY